MKNAFWSVALVLALIVAPAGSAEAGPSTQIWIPSTDIQPFLVGHVNLDNYFRASGDAEAPPNSAAHRDANIFDLGITVGVLPFKTIQMEVGFDYLVNANDPNDQHPWSGNIKLGTPEDSLFKFSPALAVGIYNFRSGADISTSDAPAVNAGQNMLYGLVAKTLPAWGSLPSLGRFSAGYYHGSKRALVDNPNLALAKPANYGVLLSWDRTMSEISDKLWFAVDYQGGRNAVGATNIGFSWAFTKNVSVLFAYDMYTKNNLAGANTFTTQVDINFP
jgi:hypothetical protein